MRQTQVCWRHPLLPISSSSFRAAILTLWLLLSILATTSFIAASCWSSLKRPALRRRRQWQHLFIAKEKLHNDSLFQLNQRRTNFTKHRCPRSPQQGDCHMKRTKLVDQTTNTAWPPDLLGSCLRYQGYPHPPGFRSFETVCTEGKFGGAWERG